MGEQVVKCVEEGLPSSDGVAIDLIIGDCGSAIARRSCPDEDGLSVA